MSVIETFGAVSATVVLVLGGLVLIQATLCAIENLRLRHQQWRATREARSRFAQAGWNIVMHDIPQGREVVCTFNGWPTEVCRRKGGNLANLRISFPLDQCTGWVDLPPVPEPDK